MAFALVGSRGAAVQGAVNASVTPAYGQAPTANNLLICWVGCAGGIPGTPSGWTLATLGHLSSAGSFAGLFYKVAAGGDVAPTVPGATGGVTAAQLGEFSGGAIPAVEDRGAATAMTSTPQTATAAGADAAAGELIVYAVSLFYSTGATKTNSMALNNGATAHDVNNNATSTNNHYLFGYGITTTNAAADAATLTWTTTKNAATITVFSAFGLPSVAAAALPVPLLGIRTPRRPRVIIPSRGQF